MRVSLKSSRNRIPQIIDKNIWTLRTSQPRHQKFIAYTRRLLNFAYWHSRFITMELVNDFVNNQFTLYIPVALVLIGIVFVFAFGFKSAEQPPFDKLSSIDSEERKTLGKKKKLKEKVSIYDTTFHIIFTTINIKLLWTYNVLIISICFA